MGRGYLSLLGTPDFDVGDMRCALRNAGTERGAVLVFNISLAHRDVSGAEHLIDTFHVAKVGGSSEFAAAISGAGLLLWMLPVAFFLLLGVIFYRRLTGRKRRTEEEDLGSPPAVQK